MLRPLLLLIFFLCLSTPLFAQENTTYPLCSEQPIMSRERIVYVTYPISRESDLYITDPDSGDTCLLQENIRATQPKWSPDGSEIAFSEIGENDFVGFTYTVHVDGTDLQRLTELGSGVSSVVWSPDGILIAYHQNPFATFDGGVIIVRAGLEGDIVAQYDPLYSEDIYPFGSPAWSPDGQQVAFPAAFVRNIQFDPILTSIYSLDIYAETDISIHLLASSTSGDNYDPTWSPDGSYIAFISEMDDTNHITVVNLQAGEKQDVSLDKEAVNIAWLADGRLVFISEDGDSYRLFVTDASMTGDWTTFERVPLPFNIVQFDWWIDPATIELPETQ